MYKGIVNAVGEPCPAPVVKTVRALGEMPEPGELEVLVDNETAVQNLLRLAGGRGLAVRQERRGDGVTAVTLTVAKLQADAPLQEEALCCPPSETGFVVAVDSSDMGRGSEELGRVLMKGFLFAVSRLPRLPETILFYNGGARLTVAGSDSLEDLRSMEAQGVEVLTCGTCLNFYNLGEPAVGGVTNMYAIVEKLAAAGKVVKP